MYEGERFNSISHLVGAAFALVGLVYLVVIAAGEGDPWKIVSFSIYGVTLLVLYLFSTLYHSVRGPAKSILRRLDHHAIYLLIAGTYTPFMLVALRGALGWTLFAINWGLAVVGIVLDSLPRPGRRILPIVIYLVMGWIGVIALGPLLEFLAPAGVSWLLAGGIFYTVGVVFYVFDKRVRHFHGIWHLFVLAGSLCHYFTVALYLA